MMKQLLFFTLIIFNTLIYAQEPDTTAYHTQRIKINGLLDQRSLKFGQYEESLNERTGIFGFQTKQDIRNSNEILRQIVINDNAIFRELKILLEYKDLQVQQVQSRAGNSAGRVQNYMLTIKKLQDQKVLSDRKIKELENSNRITGFILIFLLLIVAVSAYILFKKNKEKPLFGI